MSQHPTTYWSTTDITMTQSPERIIRDMVRKSLAINSPNLAQRLHHNDPGSIQFPPMNEERVRQWLQELYPYEFSAIRYLGMDTTDSLNLSEISALFRALLQNHIRDDWFRTSMFTPPVAESLALVLRNKRDRFMLDYYDGYNLENPHLQSTHHLTWRNVITLIAYQNQRYNNCQWQKLFSCLLQALLGGTLLPSQYSGCMLPSSLILFLRSHVDNATQTRFDYAYHRLDPSLSSYVCSGMSLNPILSSTLPLLLTRIFNTCSSVSARSYANTTSLIQ